MLILVTETGSTEYLHGKNIFYHYFMPFTLTQCYMDYRSNVRGKTKLLVENICDHFHDHEIGKNISDKTQNYLVVGKLNIFII